MDIETAIKIHQRRYHYLKNKLHTKKGSPIALKKDEKEIEAMEAILSFVDAKIELNNQEKFGDIIGQIDELFIGKNGT